MLRQNSTHNEESLSLSEHQSASASDGSVNINEKELDFESEKILGCHIIQTHEGRLSLTLSLLLDFISRFFLFRCRFIYSHHTHCESATVCRLSNFFSL